MIIGILGRLQEVQFQSTDMQSPSSCGCGKGITLTHILYQEFIQNNRKIITNFHTRHIGAEWGSPSWSAYKTSQQLFDEWFDDDNVGAVIGITELSSLVNSAARDKRVIAYTEKCLVQRRKMDYDIIWDSQVLGSADKRWRDQTDFIYKPYKWHCEWSPEFECYRPTEPCPLDKCKERHQILVHQVHPVPSTIEESQTPKLILNAWEIGQLYDTNERMLDVIRYNPGWSHIGE